MEYTIQILSEYSKKLHFFFKKPVKWIVRYNRSDTIRYYEQPGFFKRISPPDEKDGQV
jgi:hypothetical protein